MPRRDPEPTGEIVLIATVERSFEDEPDPAADELRRLPLDRLRISIRAAAKAGAIARGLGGCGEREGARVLGPRSCRARRLTVDPCRNHSREGVHTRRYSGFGRRGEPDPDAPLTSVRIRPAVRPSTGRP